jgi:four helix bundle protein
MEEQKTMSFFRFEDLRVYHKSLDYYNWLMEQVRQAGEFEKKVILLPLLDTAAKISMNIAEGSSRYKAQFVEFLKYAKSAVRECVVLTTMAKQNNMFTEEQADKSTEMLVEMTKMLGAMVVSLQKSINNRDEESKNEQVRKETSKEVDYNSSDINFEY